jgi:ribosomal protein S18 acetylase RimI-like enzyme
MPDSQPTGQARGCDERVAACSFLARLDDAAATELVPLGWGTGVFDRDRPLVWDANYVRVESDEGLDAPEVVDAVEPLFVERNLAHRAVLLTDRSEQSRLAAGFESLGWEPVREMVMALRTRPETPRHPVEEISPDAFRDARRAVELAEMPRDPASDGVLGFVDQTISRDEPIQSFASLRYVGVVSAEEVVAFCVVYSRDGIGQIELVTTLREHRGRGYGRAIVAGAAAISIADGNHLTFLVALADDWPRRMYRRLGFEAIAAQTRFRRPPSEPGAA